MKGSINLNLFLYCWRNNGVAKKKAENSKVRQTRRSFRPRCCGDARRGGCLWALQCAVVALLPLHPACIASPVSGPGVPAQVRPPSVPVRFICCCKHHVCKVQSLGRGFSSHTHLFPLLKTHRCSPQPFWNSFHAHNKGEEVFIFFLALPRISGSGYCCLTGQLNEDVFQRWHYKGHRPLR